MSCHLTRTGSTVTKTGLGVRASRIRRIGAQLFLVQDGSTREGPGWTNVRWVGTMARDEAMRFVRLAWAPEARVSQTGQGLIKMAPEEARRIIGE